MSTSGRRTATVKRGSDAAAETGRASRGRSVVLVSILVSCASAAAGYLAAEHRTGGQARDTSAGSANVADSPTVSDSPAVPPSAASESGLTAPVPQPGTARTLDDLVHLDAASFEKLDLVELNLAIAREIPECLDIDRYRRTVDEWAAWVKHEIDRHWPYEVAPRWEQEFHMLKSLTMREHASLMVGALAGYFAEKSDHASAIRWDGLAHWLDPSNRSEFISLKLLVDHTASRVLDEGELAGRKPFWQLTPHADLLKNPTFVRLDAGRGGAK